MKRIFLSLLAMIAFVACNNTDDADVIIPDNPNIEPEVEVVDSVYDLAFDDNGVCYSKNTSGITQETFEDKVVGYGWIEISCHEIFENGKLNGEDYWYMMDGGSRHHLYFESESIVKDFSSSTAFPPEGYGYPNAGQNGFSTYAYHFDASKIYINEAKNTYSRLILEVAEQDIMVCIWALNGDYALTVYKRMTEEQLAYFKQTYTRNWDEEF